MNRKEGESVSDQIISQSPEFDVSYERLSESSVLKLETVGCPEIGMAGVVTHWGRRYPKDELDKEIKRAFGEDFVVGDIGFKETWRVPPKYKFIHAFEEERMVVERLIGSVLELNGLKPEQIDALYFGGSPPYHSDYGLIHSDYGAAIAKDTGLTHLIPKEHIRNFYFACNAGGRGLRKALTNPDLYGKNVLVLTVEGLTKQMIGFNPEKADHLSHYFFSDGATAFIVVPDLTMNYLLGESEEFEDKGALAAIEPWRDLVVRPGSLIQQIGNIELIRLPPPPEGMHVYMEGGLTTRLILKNIAPSIKRVSERHNKLFPEKKIKFVIPHLASGGVITVLERKSGIIMERAVSDGNSSGATTLIGLIRRMKEFKPGDHVMIVSFGAGISWDIFVVEIGGFETSLQ